MELLHLSMTDALALVETRNHATLLSDQNVTSNHVVSSTQPSSALRTSMVKRRASKACRYCRAKKIKCSVVNSGRPCNTCQLDKMECIVTTSRRKKGHVSVAETINGLVTPQHAHPQLSDIPEEVVGPVGMSLDLHSHFPDNFITSTGSTDPSQDTANIHTSKTHSNDPLPTPGLTPAGLGTDASNVLKDYTSSYFHLPCYFRPTSLDMGVDDLQILINRGVFELPQILLQNELLQKYTEYVHPLLPLLDLDEFLTAVYSGDDHIQISLMLFYAVLTAATSFADLNVLFAAGFPDRKAARKLFFQRAKVLYDLGYETDRSSLVQALLLMTYWYEAPYDQKDPSYWMGECLLYAYSIGLHQETDDHHFDIKQKKLRRKLWWCCYMRDQLITLSMRKPSRIIGPHDVQMLALDDFDIHPSIEDTLCPFTSPMIADLGTRTTMARLCIEKVKLCTCIREILKTLYAETVVNMTRADQTKELVVMLTAKPASRELLNIIKCEQELDKWNENLPPDCWPRNLRTLDLEIPYLQVLSVHRSVLNMLYLTAVSACYRSYLGPELPSRRTSAFDLQQRSLRKVKEAACDSIAMATILHKHNSARFLPPIGVTILISALITHLMALKGNPHSNNSSLKLFQQGVVVLQTLRDAFWSAEYSYSFIDASVQRSNLEMVHGGGKRKVQGITDLMDMVPHQSLENVNTKSASGAELLMSTAAEHTGNVCNEDGLGAFVNFDTLSDSFGSETGLGVCMDDLWTMNV